MPLVQESIYFDIEYILQQSQNKSFRDYSPNIISSKRYETIKISSDGSSIKLIDKYQLDLLSIVNGTITFYHNREYFEIIGTYSKNERSGHLTYLFEILVYELGYNILSDKQHSSPGSKEFWQAQIRRQKFTIYRINIKTNYKRKANRFKENEIWGKFKNNISDLFIHSFEDFYENNLYNEEIEETVSELNFEFDEIDERIRNELENEAEMISKRQNLNMEDIRLIAQKYVN